jgi:hypothetical protein
MRASVAIDAIRTATHIASVLAQEELTRVELSQAPINKE